MMAQGRSSSVVSDSSVLSNNSEGISLLRMNTLSTLEEGDDNENRQYSFDGNKNGKGNNENETNEFINNGTLDIRFSSVATPWQQITETLFSPPLLRELIFCAVAYEVGTYMFFIWRPMFGHNHRPVPYQVTNGGDVLLDLQLANPLVQPPTITSDMLIFSCIYVPALIISLLALFSKTRGDLHAGLCTILFGVGISEALTNILKLIVGRLRPNFYALCGFDKITKSCLSGGVKEIEARLSFPSGHSSLSFCGMSILSLYLLGRVARRSNSNGSAIGGFRKGARIVCMVPLLYALFVAVSRLVDNWHHPSDVLAGIVLGSACGVFSHHLWYPAVTGPMGGIPRHTLNDKPTLPIIFSRE